MSWNGTDEFGRVANGSESPLAVICWINEKKSYLIEWGRRWTVAYGDVCMHVSQSFRTGE